ncbi:cell division protein [Chthonomonas calidirosea]|uniref:permease-like cell division protein FtsX n=1 Tax=Chthonomonas calidirosea TaxID=454171 RepID=UPI0006DD5007|nr:permease-like cell division protein FtsX [Chthonomonas calidirosea]CEK15146.1 cell division protein [Chthonomonas calidirosea]
MKLDSLFFLVQEAWLNIRRHGLMSLAALGTVTVALTVLGGCLWLGFRINEYIAAQPQKFNEIDLFLRVNVPRDKVIALQHQIETLPAVAAVHLVTKEEAWAMLEHEEPKLTQAMPMNPLMDKLTVQARDSADVGKLAAFFRNKKHFPQLQQVNDANTEVQMLRAFARMVRVLGGTAAIALFVATLFSVQNVIRLTVFARRREIRIMQLVGATASFIRFPLLLEGAVHGILGGAIASGLLLFAARQVSRFVSSLHSPLVGDIPSRITPFEVIAGLICVGAFIGITGSQLAIHRFLRQT